MTLSRVRRAQLPLLPAECAWRRRLLLRTITAPPFYRHHARSYSPCSGNHLQTTYSSSSLHRIGDSGVDNGAFISSPHVLRYPTIPCSVGNSTQVRLAATNEPKGGEELPYFREESALEEEEDPFASLNQGNAAGSNYDSVNRTLSQRLSSGALGDEGLMEAVEHYKNSGKLKDWLYAKVKASTQSSWTGRGNQYDKKWKMSVLKRQLMKEIELLEHHRYLDESEEKQRQFGKMLRTYFPNPKDTQHMNGRYKNPVQVFVPLPEYERNGSGVDDIYLYQLLWKAMGQVNEVKRKIKASMTINDRLEKYRRAQIVASKAAVRKAAGQHKLRERIQKKLQRISGDLEKGRKSLEEEMEEREKAHQYEHQRLLKARELQRTEKKLLVRSENDEGGVTVTLVSKVPQNPANVSQYTPPGQLRELERIQDDVTPLRIRATIERQTVPSATEAEMATRELRPRMSSIRFDLKGTTESEVSPQRNEEQKDTDVGSESAVPSFGEFKKFLGMSDDSPNGGGARDENSTAIESLYSMALNIQHKSTVQKDKIDLKPQSSGILDDEDPFASQKAKDILDDEDPFGSLNTKEAKPKRSRSRAIPLSASGRSARSSMLSQQRTRRFSTQATRQVSPEPNTNDLGSPNPTIPRINLTSLRDRLKEKARMDPSILTTHLPEVAAFGNLHGRFVSRAQGVAESSKEDADESAFGSDIQIADTRDPTGLTGVQWLNPGSIAEITPHPTIRPIFGVVIQRAVHGTTNYFFIMDGGDIREFSSKHCNYIEPDFISEADINKIIAATKETGAMPRELMVEVSLKLRKFQSNCKRVLLKHASKLPLLPSKVCLQNGIQYLSLEEVARRVFGKTPTKEEKYAVHSYMMQDKERFRIDLQFHSTTQLWEIRPKAYVKNIELVSGWVREQNQFVTSFAQKARTVIDIGRRLSKTHALTCESETPPTKVYALKNIEWSPTDKQILTFLNEAARARVQSSSFAPVYPVILRLVDRNEMEILDILALRAFLREIGVHSPWDDEALGTGTDDLPGQVLNYPFVKARAFNEKFATYDEGKEGYVDFCENVVDSMASLRHDWGDLTVYCIDDKSAEEIDDGVSVERVPGSGTEVWLHVHVANPTAFIPMDHELAKMAREKVQSLYVTQRSYPMLPTAITRKYLSLAPHRPVLTFSLRMNTTTGTILEYNIKSGTVHNVRRLTYSQMDRLFNGDNLELERRVFTNRPPRMRKEMLRQLEQDSHREWSQEERDDISLILTALVANFRLRSKEGLSTPSFPRSDVRVDDGKGNKNRRGIGDNPVIRLGTPYIDVFTEHRPWDANRPEFLVVSAMLLASHCAGDWLVKRGLAAPYRGLTRMWDNQEAGEVWKRAVSHAKTGLGVVVDQRIDALYPNDNVTQISPVPKKHDLLGFTTYVKCTSPLRRYADMLTHYIIEHELRNDALPQARRKPALFDVNMMSKECKHLEPKERFYSTVQGVSERFWLVRLINDLYKSGHLPFPQVLAVKLNTVQDFPRPATAIATGFDFLRFRVAMPSNEVQKSVQSGDIVYCKFSDDQSEYNDAARAVTYHLEYLGPKTTIEETKEQFFADLELRKKGELAVSRWPVDTESDIAEAEAIAKTLPESKFVTMRRERARTRLQEGRQPLKSDAEEEHEKHAVPPGAIGQDDSDPLFKAQRMLEAAERRKIREENQKANAEAMRRVRTGAKDKELTTPKIKTLSQLKKEALMSGRGGAPSRPGGKKATKQAEAAE